MIDDGQLLRQYLEQRSEAAFTELVRRHVNVVYFAALRRVGGDRHLADDVAQSVFADLARKAPSLLDRPVLIGWLYTSTRFAAAQAVRSEQRRRTHEQEAQTVNELNSTPEANWNQLRPVLDDAMDELNEQEREVVLLRFFEQLPLAQVGARFSISADAARMRVDRALEKLRGLLDRRGLASTSAALATLVATQSGLAVPPGVVAKIIGRVLPPTATATTIGLGKIAAGLVAAGVAVGLVVYQVDSRRGAQGAPAVSSVTEENLAPVSAAEPDFAAAPVSAAVAAALPAAPESAAPARTFSQLTDVECDILKVLWSGQERNAAQPGIRTVLRVGRAAPNFSAFSAGRALLLAKNLIALAPNGEAVHLTNQGMAFCRRSQADIDAYPAFYHPIAGRGMLAAH